MRAAIENHIRNVDAFYRPLILHAADRLTGAERLLAQFEQSASAFRQYGRRQASGVIERVNELAVANKLLSDPHLESAIIAYEPEIVAGPKFDFVITAADGQTHYIEVKTVSLQSTNSEASWRKATYQARQVVLDPSAPLDENAIRVRPSFAARPAFLRYALQTEAKLAAHAVVKAGRGVLVFCGDGLGWDVPDVDEFAESYHAGTLTIEPGSRSQTGSLHGFAVLIRQQDTVEPSTWDRPSWY